MLQKTKPESTPTLVPIKLGIEVHTKWFHAIR
jgi:hypothetical protein